MTIRDITAELERFAAPELQEDYDNSGLLCGDASWACTGVLCALDVTPAVISEAQERGCNLVVAHHPLLFKGLKRINGRGWLEQTLVTAIKGDVAIYACHTNLDNVVEGVNARMAQKIGLTGTRILLPKPKMLRRLITFAPVDQAESVRQAIFDAGAGHIGNYAECSFNSEGTGTFKAGTGADPFVGEIGKRHHERETKIEIVYPFYLELQIVQALVAAHPYEEVAYDIFTMDNVHFGIGAGIIGKLQEPVTEEAFLAKLQAAFGVPVVRHTAFTGKKIQTVALCGGAGAFLIKKAIAGGADCYITADVKYHEFFDADGQLLLADIGHFESEQYTIDLLHDLIVKKFPTFAVLKTSVRTNPVHYFRGS